MNSEYSDNPEAENIKIAIALMEANRDWSWKTWQDQIHSLNLLIISFFFLGFAFAVAACWLLICALPAFSCVYCMKEFQRMKREAIEFRDEMLSSRTENIVQLKEYLKTVQ